MNMPRKSIGYRFAMLHRLQISFYRDAVRRLGIRPSQAPFVAELLSREAPISQEALATCCVIDPGATARALAQLEQAGLVRRQPNPHNRRQNMVAATEKARCLEDAFFAAVRSATTVFLKGFTEREHRLALRLLDRMMANGLEERYGARE